MLCLDGGVFRVFWRGSIFYFLSVDLSLSLSCFWSFSCSLCCPLTVQCSSPVLCSSPFSLFSRLFSIIISILFVSLSLLFFFLIASGIVGSRLFPSYDILLSLSLSLPARIPTLQSVCHIKRFLLFTVLNVDVGRSFSLSLFLLLFFNSHTLSFPYHIFFRLISLSLSPRCVLFRCSS